MLTSKSPEVGIVTFGGSGARAVVEMGRVDTSTIDRINTIQSSDGIQDSVDGLKEAMGVFSRIKQTTSDNKMILLITDGEYPINNFDALESQVMPYLDSTLLVAMLGKVDEDSSSIYKRENAKLYQSMADSCGGKYVEAMDIGDMFPLFAQAAGLTTTPRPTKLLLHITSCMSIPCQYWAEVSKQSLPALSKRVDKDKYGRRAGAAVAVTQEMAAGASIHASMQTEIGSFVVGENAGVNEPTIAINTGAQSLGTQVVGVGPNVSNAYASVDLTQEIGIDAEAAYLTRPTTAANGDTVGEEMLPPKAIGNKVKPDKSYRDLHDPDEEVMCEERLKGSVMGKDAYIFSVIV
jgi:hypothetical protein